MRVGNLSAGTAKLHEAMESLEEAWQQSQEDWKDANALNFERNHLEQVGPHLKMALDAIGRLSEVLARARRDCE